MQNKHIIRFSFLGVFFIVIANIVLYRQFIVESVILREISGNDKLLVEAYRDKVWHLFPGVIKKLRIGVDDDLFTSKEFATFKQHTSDFFLNRQDTEVLKVQIFDSTENEIFSSNKLKIESNNEKSPNIIDYIMTKIDNMIFEDLIEQGLFIPRASVVAVYQKDSSAIIAIGRVPIFASGGMLDGIVVISRDVTGLWREVRSLELKILSVFLGFFIILFIIIIYNTRYAQNIINQHSRINKLLEEAKRKAENESIAKTQFLANVSHELRTPLNSIIGFSEIILSDKDNRDVDAKHMDYVQDIHNSGKHLLSLINDILDYSKVTAKRLKVDMIEVNLNKLIVSSMRFVEPEAQAAKISMIKDMPDEQIIIKADPKRLKQALLNLLSNAVKFTPANGNITLRVSKLMLKKRVSIKVIDTGIGISKENIPKALASFQQVDNKKNRRFEGTGLGLPLTKKLVELMKGTFEIASLVGQGTTVTLTFRYEEEV